MKINVEILLNYWYLIFVISALLTYLIKRINTSKTNNKWRVKDYFKVLLFPSFIMFLIVITYNLLYEVKQEQFVIENTASSKTQVIHNTNKNIPIVISQEPPQTKNKMLYFQANPDNYKDLREVVVVYTGGKKLKLGQITIEGKTTNDLYKVKSIEKRN